MGVSLVNSSTDYFACSLYELKARKNVHATRLSDEQILYTALVLNDQLRARRLTLTCITGGIQDLFTLEGQKHFADYPEDLKYIADYLLVHLGIYLEAFVFGHRFKDPKIYAQCGMDCYDAAANRLRKRSDLSSLLSSMSRDFTIVMGALRALREEMEIKIEPRLLS